MLPSEARTPRGPWGLEGPTEPLGPTLPFWPALIRGLGAQGGVGRRAVVKIVIMPRLDIDMESGAVVEWRKREGEPVGPAR